MQSLATERPQASQANTTKKVLERVGQERIHYLDNLRAIAMLLGVVLHAGLAYAQPSQSIWLATDPGSSVVIDASIWFIHLFRMSLFFLLSGYLAKLVVQRKGVKQFLWNRATRIVLTFVLFYPLLLVAMTVVIVFAISYLDAPKGLMGLIAAASKSGAKGAEASGLTTMHLWFLYYLVFFAISSALFSRITWLRFDWLLARPACLALLPLVLVPAILKAGVPLPAPESFTPTWWPFAFYGLFYWAGWQLNGREKLLDQCSPYVWHIGALCGLLFVPYYLCMPVLDLSLLTTGTASAGGWNYFVAAVLTCYLATLLTLLSLVMGKRFLQQRSAFLGLIADASFWVYLIHLPLVIFLQTLLIPLGLPVWIKLGITVSATMMFCIATYLVFVRYTPVGWLLHGKRLFP